MPGVDSGPAEAVRRFGLRAAWPAIALYAGLRAVSLLLLWYFAAKQGESLLEPLIRYDAVWYADIVQRGYDQAIPLKPDGSLATTNLAFFPLFPQITALVDPVVPGGPQVAGVLVSWLAGLAAAWGLFAIGTQVRDRRTGVLLAGLWAVLPHALVQSMGYSETLFTALCAWSLFALLRRHWMTAALLCVLAGLTRPTGAALAVAVGLAALFAVVRRQDGWRPWVAGLVAPLGFVGFLTFVGVRLGRADGYFHVQKDAWKMSFDAGRYTLRTAYGLLLKPSLPALYVTTLVLLLALALLAMLITLKVPWPLWVFALTVLAMVLVGEGYYHAKARLLMPAFPLLLPIAYALARARQTTAVIVLAVLTLVSASYSVYLAFVWTYSP